MDFDNNCCKSCSCCNNLSGWDFLDYKIKSGTVYEESS